MHNVKASMQFAFNASMMAGPTETKTVDAIEAANLLRLSCNSSETRFNISHGAIHVSQDAKVD
jgi:hypothetical protein